ncbi:MAG: type III secretion system translocon subunit SctE [Kistimonas sp.]|nr:type III secretion system translocon subunit SctE [Kistimonas sp.]
MSSSGGVAGGQATNARSHASVPAGDGREAQSGRAGESANTTGTNAGSRVGRGYTTANTVSHKNQSAGKDAGPVQDRVVKIPPPRVDPVKVVTPEMQAQVAQVMDSTEMLFTFDELMSQLDVENESLEGDGESSGASSVYGAVRKGRSQKNNQDGGGAGQGSDGQASVPPELMKTVSRLTQDVEPERLAALQDETLHIFDKVAAIESAPPEVLSELKGASEQLAQALVTGDIEDIARLLTEIQVKLQDTRIKFDEQAIRSSRLKRSQIHDQRIGKLSQAIAKMDEARTAGIVGKVFSAVATALAVVVAAVTIATGVGAKAGVMLIMAATVMVALTISQNTGDWMTNLGGAIKDDKAQLVMGLGWAVLAAVLSLGAGLAGSAAKAPADVATTTVQQTTNAGVQAAQQSANASAQVAQQGAGAASQTAQQAAQQTASALQETTKAATKAATDAVDDVAEQATRVAVKSAQESVKEASRAAADAAKETVKETIEETGQAITRETTKEAGKAAAEQSAKETAKQVAEVSKKTLYYQRAARIAQFTQGGSMAVEGASTISAASSTYEGEMYQADAQEDLAFLTKIQLQMEDWMEAISRALEEISQGQEAASDMLSQAQQSKFTVTRNI